MKTVLVVVIHIWLNVAMYDYIIIWEKVWIICQESLPLRYDLPSDLGNRSTFKFCSCFSHKNIMARRFCELMTFDPFPHLHKF